MPQLPSVAVTNVSLSKELPEEGERVRIIALVASNESLPVNNITVHFLVDQVEVGNVTWVNLAPRGNRTVSVDWTTVKWDHIVAVTLEVNGMPVMSGTLSEVISVAAKPIGDLPTLVYSLALVVAFLLAIAMAPSIRARLIR